METSERLRLIKEKIQEKSKSNIVEELQILNRSFNDLRFTIIGSDRVESVKENEDLVELFKLMNERLAKLEAREEFRVSNLKDLPRPQVNMPDKIEISNIDKAKADKVKIDWENQPKKKQQTQEVEIKGLDKALEKIAPKNDEIPSAVDFLYTFDRKWKLIKILYSNMLLNVRIQREANGDISRLTFEAVSQGQ